MLASQLKSKLLVLSSQAHREIAGYRHVDAHIFVAASSWEARISSGEGWDFDIDIRGEDSELLSDMAVEAASEDEEEEEDEVIERQRSQDM